MRSLLLVLLFVQGSPQELIEQLRSDRAEVRERALKQLKELGKAAIPELQLAAKDPDPEVAGRATAALRVIALRESLSPELRRKFPGVEDRLAGAPDAVYAEVFLEACENPALKPADYESLAAAAVRGAGPEVLRNVLGHIMSSRFLSAVPELVKLLRNPDASLAEYADQVLVLLDRATSKAANLSLLDDPDSQIRANVIRRLVELGDPDVLPRISALITDKEPFVRQWVYIAFGRLGTEKEAPRLLAALQDPMPTIQEAAADALITLDPPGLAAAVRPLFRSPNETERLQAVRIMGSLHVTDAVPLILKQLPSPDSQMRCAVPWALADLHATDSGAVLLPLLEDPDEDVRAAALWAVGVLRIKAAGGAVAKLVLDPEHEVRVMACWAAGRLEVREAVPGLLKTLGEQQSELACAAAWPLGVLKVQEALPKLLELAKQENSTGTAAVVAASRLTELPSTADMLAFLETANWESLGAFGPAVRRLKPPELRAALIKKIEEPDTDEDERDLAIDAVKEFRMVEAAPALLKSFRNDEMSESTRGKAAQALARCNVKEALPEILALLGKEDIDFRGDLISALADFGAKDVIRKYLKSKDESDILAAVRGLAQLDAREALDDVLPLLQMDDEQIRTQAAGWLCHAGRREGAEVLFKTQSRLIPLNAMRRPDAWKKLAEVHYTQDVDGTIYEILERLTQDAGLALEWRWAGGRETFSLLERHAVHVGRDSLSGAQVLEELLTFFDGVEFDFVLEDSALRVVSSGSARRTFRLWLESTKKR